MSINYSFSLIAYTPDLLSEDMQISTVLSGMPVNVNISRAKAKLEGAGVEGRMAIPGLPADPNDKVKKTGKRMT